MWYKGNKIIKNNFIDKKSISQIYLIENKHLRLNDEKLTKN